MIRKVKCKICGKEGTNDTFYKVTDDKGKNKYYCSQDEYETYLNEQRKRYELMKYIAEDIFEYNEGQIVHPILVKKIGDLHKFYDYEVIHECFRRNKETIQYWIKNKDFSSEYGMIMYVLKIIEGNINDVYKQWKINKEQGQQKNKRNSVDFISLNETLSIVSFNNKNKTIIEFLEEEDI